MDALAQIDAAVTAMGGPAAAVAAVTGADGQPAAAPRFTAVEEGPELLRILALPRRPAPRVDSPTALETAAFLTQVLAKVPTPYPGKLRAMQGCGLQELWQCRGLAGFIRVGGGKMLMSYLAEAVLRAPPPAGVPALPEGLVLLVAPGQMWNDPATAAHFRKFEQSWRGPRWRDVVTESFERLSQPQTGADLDEQGNVVRPGYLDQLRPAVIVIDEGHKVSSRDNVARRRIEAYKRRNPWVVVVVLTGSPFNTSIKDAAHLLEWALGEGSPLPRPSLAYTELEMWSHYLDVTQKNGPRTGVGALLRFLTEAERASFHAEYDGKLKRKVVRRAIARWMYDTPGVLSSQEGKLIDDDGREIGLSISPLDPPCESDEVDEFFLHLRGDKLQAARNGEPREMTTGEDGAEAFAYPGWRLPDGTEGDDGLWFSRNADCGGLGFWMRFAEPVPPPEYVQARNGMAKWVRNLIKTNRRGIDSAAGAIRAARKGLYDSEGLLEFWDEQRTAFTATTGLKEPKLEAVWLSDEAIRAAEEWARAHGGLIWVRYAELGTRLARELDIPFYQKGAKDAKTKLHISEHRGGPAVVSVQSAKEGKNLQGLWSANLWMTPPGEQSLARTHRAGQRADVVGNWIYIGCYEHLATYVRSRDDKADFAEDFTLQAQKLVYAAGEMPSLEAIKARQANRWTPSD